MNQINILSSSRKTNNPRLFTGCAVDIGYVQDFQERNILDDPYFSDIFEIGLRGTNFPGISTSDYGHWVEAGKGYACNPPCDDMDGGKVTKNLYDEWSDWADECSMEKAFIANLQTGTLDEVRRSVQKGCTIIIYSGEQNLKENAWRWPGGGADYKAEADAWMVILDNEFPGLLTHIIDTAPEWVKNTSNNISWNKGEEGIKGHMGRMYWWADDLCDCSTISSIDEAFSDVVPGWGVVFQSKFHGKKIAILQCGWKGSSPNVGTGLNAYFLTKARLYAMKHEEIGYWSFMSLKSLDQRQLTKDILKLHGKFAAAEYLFETASTEEGLEIQAGASGSQYMVLVVNKSDAENVVSFRIDGSRKMSRQEGYSFSSWDSGTPEVINTSASKAITIPPRSIQVVYLS